MKWNVLAVQIGEEIYYSLISRERLSEEQKGYCNQNKRNRRATIHWSTDTQRVKNETKKSSCSVDWLKKACDIVPQSWMIECLRVHKIFDEVIKVIENTMENWGMELTAREKSLAEAKVQSGINQGDALSPLLFITAMMPLNHIHRKRTGGYKLY